MLIIKNPEAKKHSHYHATIECVPEEKLSKDHWWNKNDNRVIIMPRPEGLNMGCGIIAGFSIGSIFDLGSDNGTITFEQNLKSKEQRTWIVALLGKKHSDYWSGLDVDQERLTRFFQEIEDALPSKQSVDEKLSKTDPLYEQMKKLEDKQPKTKEIKESIKGIKESINQIQQKYIDDENSRFRIEENLIIQNGIKLGKELGVIE